MEKIMRPISGYLALILAIAAILAGVYVNAVSNGNPAFVFPGVLLLIAGVFLIKGIMIVNPNHARVCVFFGKYIAGIKSSG
ncbi:MAG: hypothetical protein J0H29_01135 [Sphingobacteriales bacterium]|nr:hypothetical protein [Sphingobacteriales bacterium]